ncbi:MAG TPA: acetylglutamate kinase [Planctomycetes bacterium]|nr:acetylglutamate kinase [Planctomycetota bacterium]
MNPRAAARALRAALPYLTLYQDRIFVVKASGSLFAHPHGMEILFEQLSVLHRVGIEIVFVHGGGMQTTELARTLGVEPQFAGGRRITCATTLDAAVMTMRGTLGAQAVGAFRKLGVPAVGLSGLDGDLVTARRRPPVEVDGESVDYGHVGDVVTVNPGVLRSLADSGFVPVVNPIAADAEGQPLNINADTIAAHLAGALGAAKLILLTEAPGLLEDPDDPHSLVALTDREGLRDLVGRGATRGGMLPKAAAIEHALEHGVPRVHVVSWRNEDSLLAEIFTNEGSGTMIVDHLDEAEDGWAEAAS